ncbi:hypothetical protein [Kutzneria kofuensis]|uniref:hypothetical protein n=1 Tax=Kutzneria kofuensis TaxID=103725 RepID=UPI0031E97537
MSASLPGLPEHGPFALLHRPGSGNPNVVEVLAGPVHRADLLADLDLDGRAARAGDGPAALVLLPYRQIAERGYPCPDDGEPLLLMDVHSHHKVPVEQALAALPGTVPPLDGIGFDIGDLDYGRLVRRVQRTEIEAGEGSNFVLSRSLRGRFREFDGTPRWRCSGACSPTSAARTGRSWCTPATATWSAARRSCTSVCTATRWR